MLESLFLIKSTPKLLERGVPHLNLFPVSMISSPFILLFFSLIILLTVLLSWYSGSTPYPRFHHIMYKHYWCYDHLTSFLISFCTKDLVFVFFSRKWSKIIWIYWPNSDSMLLKYFYREGIFYSRDWLLKSFFQKHWFRWFCEVIIFFLANFYSKIYQMTFFSYQVVQTE